MFLRNYVLRLYNTVMFVVMHGFWFIGAQCFGLLHYRPTCSKNHDCAAAGFSHFYTSPRNAIAKVIFGLAALASHGIILNSDGQVQAHSTENIYTVFQKNQAPKLLAVTLSNLNRF